MENLTIKRDMGMIIKIHWFVHTQSYMPIFCYALLCQGNIVSSCGFMSSIYPYQLLRLIQNQAHFMNNNFSNIIKVQWKFHSASTGVFFLIAMKFCTLHDSCAVVPHAKFCSNMISYCGVTLKPIFNSFWIGKIVYEMGPSAKIMVADDGAIHKEPEHPKP